MTNGVYTTGDQTIAGVKTFSSAPVVPDNSFTFAKLQDIPTATILGRNTAGTGDVEALPLTVTSAGWVGIGITPTTLLDVSGPSARIRFRESTTGLDFQIKSLASPTRFGIGSVDSSAALGILAGDVERFRFANNGAQSSVIPGGSTLYPQFACRAWVNFNGIGTVAIRAAGNVTSITDNGVGDYTVNFTNAMPDANFSVAASVDGIGFNNLQSTATSSVRLRIAAQNGTVVDAALVNVAIFR